MRPHGFTGLEGDAAGLALLGCGFRGRARRERDQSHGRYGRNHDLPHQVPFAVLVAGRAGTGTGDATATVLRNHSDQGNGQ